MDTVCSSPRPRFMWPSAIAIGVIHLLPLGALWTGVALRDVAVCVLLYVVRGLCITGGYHRYFSHRSYQLPSWMQYLVALIGTTAVQNGPLWWAARHRHHHRYSDQPQDLHSPIRGFWWAHIGWLLYDEDIPIPPRSIRDLAQHRVLRLLDRFHYLPPIGLGALCLWIGPSTLYIGFFLSTVLVWHSTWAVNSITHLWGKRRYVTTDTSRDSSVVALLTLGEGSHCTHHRFPWSVRVGFRWWQFDVTYLLIRCLAWVGLARNLRSPSAAELERARIRVGDVDVGILQARWQRLCRRMARLHARAREFCHDEAAALERFLIQMRERWDEVIRNHPQRAALDELLLAMHRKRREIANLLKQVQYA